MRRALTRQAVQATLRALAFIARRRSLGPASDAVARTLAAIVVSSKRIRPAGQLADLGPLWQRAFPSPAQVPIERVSEDTVYARIHTPCPLRGTGDLQACHRMMEFDREVLRRVGGQFVVLESQAEPGVRHCRVAMRLEGRSLDGLVPAVERCRIDTP